MNFKQLLIFLVKMINLCMYVGVLHAIIFLMYFAYNIHVYTYYCNFCALHTLCHYVYTQCHTYVRTYANVMHYMYVHSHIPVMVIVDAVSLYAE